MLLVMFGFLSSHFGQQKFWVVLKDKKGVSFDPYTYFDQKAIDRRVKHNLPICDISDYPLNESYVSQVNDLSDTISGHSRWMNALACIVSSEEQLNAIKNLSCVSEIIPMQSEQILADANLTREPSESKKNKLTFLERQIGLMEGEKFKEAGITGKGVRVCIIDAGFPGVDFHDEFAHIRRRSGIIATRDFHKNQKDVYRFHEHGTMVLSCVAGVYDDEYNMGMATGADFLLARTERIMKEGLSEEEDWLMAVEWADKKGADIINSSLGYTVSLYFKEDMDGKTSFITRAANKAASKGILVVNAAGNEGASYWKYIAAPADADSVLTIGGINPWTGIHTSFSSYGPTADKRRKPNVSAYGHVLARGKYSGLTPTQGTSFSSPLVAGFAACVLEMDSTLTCMELFKKIEESAQFYPYYDYAHGYGIPKAGYFLDSLEKAPLSSPIFEFEIDEKYITINVCEDHFEINDEVVFNYDDYFGLFKSRRFHKFDGYNANDGLPLFKDPNYIYYHFEDENGQLAEYAIVAPYKQDALKVKIHKHDGELLRVWYKNKMKEIQVKEYIKLTDEEREQQEKEEEEDDEE